MEPGLGVPTQLHIWGSAKQSGLCFPCPSHRDSHNPTLLHAARTKQGDGCVQRVRLWAWPRSGTQETRAGSGLLSHASTSWVSFQNPESGECGPLVPPAASHTGLPQLIAKVVWVSHELQPKRAPGFNEDSCRERGPTEPCGLRRLPPSPSRFPGLPCAPLLGSRVHPNWGWILSVLCMPVAPWQVYLGPFLCPLTACFQRS